MIDLLDEENLNDRTDIKTSLIHTKKLLRQLESRFDDLKNRYPTDHYYKLLNPIADLLDDDLDLVYLLWNYFLDYFPDFNLLKTGFKRDDEVKRLGDLIRNLDLSNANQTMAFNNIAIDDIYNKTIVQVSNFTLHRPSKLKYDLRSTSTLYYDVVLPFHDKNYVNSTDCTRAKDLPKFFSPN